MIDKQPSIGTTRSGDVVDAYALVAGNVRARILTLGGTITHLETPDRAGTTGDVVLGFDDLASYETKSPYFGCAVGRVGNRIAAGKFTLDGASFTLATNDGQHHLHGGKRGYDKRVWQADAADTADGPALRLTLRDLDGTENYPGTVDVTMTYTLTSAGTLRIDYVATADRATPINLTNHTYFNLKDAGATTHHDHVMQIDADRYTPVNEKLIPTGEIAPVRGTPIDFTRPKPIGQDLVAMGGSPVGYDHNLVMRTAPGELARCARVVEPTTGRVMECWTTEPGVQFYTGNFLDGSLTGKQGNVYRQYAGFCLETQHFPDSVNQPSFPSTVLRPGQTYRSTTEYRFSTDR